MTAVRSNVFKRVAAILAEHLGAEEEEITLDTNVYEDLNADVLEFHDGVIPVIEEEFGIAISDEDVPELTTVKELVTYITESV